MKTASDLQTSSLLLSCQPSQQEIADISKRFQFSAEADGLGIVATIRDSVEVVSTFGLTPIRGNSSVVVSHGVELAENYRGKGFGVYFHQLRLAWLQRYRASMALCTVVQGNISEELILHKFGWLRISSSTNPKTSNTFNLYSKQFVYCEMP